MWDTRVGMEINKEEDENDLQTGKDLETMGEDSIVGVVLLLLSSFFADSAQCCAAAKPCVHAKILRVMRIRNFGCCVHCVICVVVASERTHSTLFVNDNRLCVCSYWFIDMFLMFSLRLCECLCRYVRFWVCGGMRGSVELVGRIF